jgi:hypothetical protein
MSAAEPKATVSARTKTVFRNICFSQLKAAQAGGRLIISSRFPVGHSLHYHAFLVSLAIAKISRIQYRSCRQAAIKPRREIQCQQRIHVDVFLRHII